MDHYTSSEGDMSYCINGWDEEYDDRTGKRYYKCHDCGYTEGTGHADDCPRHMPLEEDS